MNRERLENYLIVKHHFAARTVKMLNDVNLISLVNDYRKYSGVHYGS